MTLDRLYSLVKRAKFPIRNRDELIRVIGNELIRFEGHVMNAEEIAVHITKYPIRSVSEFFKDFFEEEVEAYNMEEVRSLGMFEAMTEH